jgi:hypothetical protein
VMPYPSRQSRPRYVRSPTSGDILSLCNKSLLKKEIYATWRGSAHSSMPIDANNRPRCMAA